MAEKISDASYDEGRAAFASGASVRSIVEQIMAVDDAGTAAAHRQAEISAISGALGFADALLDLLRKPLVIVNSAHVLSSQPKPSQRKRR